MVCILFPNFKFSTLCCSLYFENLLFQLHSKITVYKMKRTRLSASHFYRVPEQEVLLNNRLSLRLLSICKFSLKIVVFLCDI
jgi:hypothetical protein